MRNQGLGDWLAILLGGSLALLACGDSDPASPPAATPPTVSITSPAAGQLVAPSATFVYAAGESASVVCTVDGADEPCTTGGTLDLVLPDGPHTFTVQGFDSGGNPGAVASVTFTVDGKAPVIESLAVQSSSGGTARIAYTASDASGITSVSCRVDGGPVTACGAGAAGIIELSGLSVGPHGLEVHAVDSFGNSGAGSPVSAAPAEHVAVDLDET